MYLLRKYMKIGRRVLTDRELIKILGKNSEKIRLGRRMVSKAEIYVDDNLKKKLVEVNPQLAQNLYYSWRDHGETKIGRYFAIRYNGDKEFGAAAYHIAQELSIPGIQRPESDVVKVIEREEQRRFSKIRPEKFDLSLIE